MKEEVNKMNEYYIVVDTGISGYEIGNIIEAYTEEEARAKAIEEAKEEIRYMMNHLVVNSVERW